LGFLDIAATVDDDSEEGAAVFGGWTGALSVAVTAAIVVVVADAAAASATVCSSCSGWVSMRRHDDADTPNTIRQESRMRPGIKDAVFVEKVKMLGRC